MNLREKIQNEITEILIEKYEPNTFLFSLFTFGKYKEINSDYLFKIKNSNSINFMLNYIEKFANEVSANSIEKNKHEYLLIESKPQYTVEYDDYGVIIYPEDLSFVLGMLFILSGNIKSFENQNLEFQCDMDDYHMVGDLFEVAGLNMSVIEKNNGIYFYTKSIRTIEKFFDLIGEIKTVQEELTKKNDKSTESYIRRISAMEVNNIKKTSDITSKLIGKVKLLKEDESYNELDDDIKMLIDVKLDNPEMSFSELAEKISELTNTEIKKQRVAYLFKKLGL